jgi:hypothetical protein
MILTTGIKDPVNKILWDETKAKRANGGFTLPSGLPGLYLLKGAPLSVNYTTRTANAVKTATVLAGSTATVTRLPKGSSFVVGSVISNVVGAIAVAVTAIDETNAAYDALTHATVTTPFVTGSVIFEATAAGATSTYLNAVNALLSDNVKLVGSPTVTAVIAANSGIKSSLSYLYGDESIFNLTLPIYLKKWHIRKLW